MTSFPPRPTDPVEDTLFDFGGNPGRAPANDLEATLLRVQRAAGGKVAGPPTIPTDLKQQIWENLMNANATTSHATLGQHVFGSGRAAELAPPVTSRRIGRVAPWSHAANAFLAAALLLALTAGIWRIAQDRGFGLGGNGPEPSSIQFESLIQDDGSIDPADLPTAEDCTVEPLTVDEVMAILVDDDQHADDFDADEQTPLHTTSTPELTPDAQGYLPAQETVDVAAEVYWMWTACNMADSLFQRWAVETPNSVESYILSRLPNLTSEDEARAILEELWETGESDLLLLDVSDMVSEQPIGTPPSDHPIAATLVDPEPANSWTTGYGYFMAGVAFYSADGERMGSRAAQESWQYAQMTGESPASSCTVPEFLFDPDRDTWLVQQGDIGCG